MGGMEWGTEFLRRQRFPLGSDHAEVTFSRHKQVSRALDGGSCGLETLAASVELYLFTPVVRQHLLGRSWFFSAVL